MSLNKMTTKDLQSLIDSLEDNIARDQDRLNSGTLNPDETKVTQNRLIANRSLLRQAQRELQRKKEAEDKEKARIASMKPVGSGVSFTPGMTNEEVMAMRNRMRGSLNRGLPGTSTDPSGGQWRDRESYENWLAYQQSRIGNRYWDEREGRWVEGAPTGPGAMPSIMPGGREGVAPPPPPPTNDRGPVVTQPVIRSRDNQMVGYA